MLMEFYTIKPDCKITNHDAEVENWWMWCFFFSKLKKNCYQSYIMC